jgi:hypothetical protein
MSGLVACPFCRQMFPAFDAKTSPTCPECGLKLTDVAKLGPSYDAQLIDPEEPLPPHMETLPWTFPGRMRAPLLALAVIGLALFFFAPWARETAPELRDLTGFGFARRLGWMWAPAVAYFVMIPLVLTRRSIYLMRGARFAIGFLALIALMTVVMRVAVPPASNSFVPLRFTFRWGLYASGLVASIALAAAAKFGGSLDDIPTRARREGDETLH